MVDFSKAWHDASKIADAVSPDIRKINGALDLIPGANIDDIANSTISLAADTGKFMWDTAVDEVRIATGLPPRKPNPNDIDLA